MNQTNTLILDFEKNIVEIEAKIESLKLSAEEGTVAANMEDQILERIKNKREELVMSIQNEILEKRNESFVGKTIDVLVESYDRIAECWFGRSKADAPDIDCKVFFSGKPKDYTPGEFVKVKISDFLDYDIMGEVEPIEFTE